jgi:Protein of unknown function (DUF2934)
MSKISSSGSHSSSQQHAAEVNYLSEHVAKAAEHADDQEHLKASEQTRLDTEHHASPELAGSHGIHNFGHREIAELAYKHWQARGCPEGSADEDWASAVKELRSRNVSVKSMTAKS